MLQEELRITRIPTFNTFARQVRLLQFVLMAHVKTGGMKIRRLADLRPVFSLLLISVAAVRSRGKKAGSYIIHVARGLVLPLGMYTCLHTSPPQIKKCPTLQRGRQRESRALSGPASRLPALPRGRGGGEWKDQTEAGGVGRKAIRDARVMRRLVAYLVAGVSASCVLVSSDVHSARIYEEEQIATVQGLHFLNAVQLSVMSREGG